MLFAYVFELLRCFFFLQWSWKNRWYWMESKVENSTKGPESSDKRESNTFTCLWLILVSLLEQLKM